MIIGIPKEVKTDEKRVGLTPAAVASLTADGHEIIVQTGAGVGSLFADTAYQKAGAEVAASAAEVWAAADLVVKVKEPIEGELDEAKTGQTLFTYLHLAGCESVTKRVLKSRINAIAYETVTDENGGLPALQPMSRIAGQLAVDRGSQYMTAAFGGCGTLFSRNPGSAIVKTVVLGGGTVGLSAAKRAAEAGSFVVLLEKSNTRINELENADLPRNIFVQNNTPQNLHAAMTNADLVIAAVLVPGAEAPKLIHKNHIKLMKRGVVIVDVSIDQGGCVDMPQAKTTTHTNPIIELGLNDARLYAVSNMPGSVPATATQELTASTLQFVQALASLGIEEAIKADPHLANGVNAWRGKLTNKAVAKAHNLPFVSLAEAMSPAAGLAERYVGC